MRFVSHRDIMRALGRIVARANVPVRFTQGFNPHPRLSLPCPRPVGLASRDDLLVVTLDEPVEADGLLASLNANAPAGLRFLRARPLDSPRSPQPKSMRCELTVANDRIGIVRSKLSELAEQRSWPIERRTQIGKRKVPSSKTVDIRPLVADIALGDNMLRIVFSGSDGRWARPAEVLDLLGLDGRVDLADMVRTQVEYEM